MKKHKNKTNISPEALITTIIVGAILSAASWLIIAFIWGNVATFDASAALNTASLSGIVFGLAVGYRIRDIIHT